jgi:hypothetical protein
MRMNLIFFRALHLTTLEQQKCDAAGSGPPCAQKQQTAAEANRRPMIPEINFFAITLCSSKYFNNRVITIQLKQNQ